MKDYWVETISTDSSHLSEIERILSLDSRTGIQPYFKLTSSTVAKIQQICPQFCSQATPKPEVFNQKTKTAVLLSEFYPGMPVYAIDEQTLIMPYFEYTANVEEMIQEARRILVTYHRIVMDMCIINNFKKLPQFMKDIIIVCRN